MWRFVAPAFEDRFRVALFDHVGAGHSDVAAYDREKYASLDGYAQDVLEICRELELRDVIFVGHSVSAMIGVLAAIEEPERFSRLVLVGPSPRYLDDDGYVGGFSREDIDGLLASLASNYLGWSSGARPTSGPTAQDLYSYGPQALLDGSLKANPWMSAFEGGTAIYRGLNVARRALERAHADRGQIVLISDLEDGQDPRTRTALLRIAAAKLQMRVVGLNPTEASKRMYLDVFGPQVLASKPKLAASVQGDQPERASGTRKPIPAALLAVLLLALFGWWQTPLRLRAAER